MFSKSVLGFLLLTFISPWAFAEITFISVKDEAWKQKTLSQMAWVNSQLPKDWKRPETFSVAYVEKGQPSYYPIFRYTDSDGVVQIVEKLLVVNDDSLAKLVHEYAHLVQDVHMRNVSPPWQYYLTWNKISFTSVDDSAADYEKQIASLKEMKLEYQAKKEAGDEDPFVDKIINNLTNSIERYGNLLEELKKAQQLQAKSKYAFDSFNSMQVLMPEYELFADSMAVLLLDNWSAMKEETLKDVSNLNIVLPPGDTEEESIQLLLEHRDFRVGLSIETYDFKEWESDGPYTQHAPLRSKIRSLKENEGLSNTKVLEVLGNAVLSFYEKELIPQPELVKQSLYEKNKTLDFYMDLELSHDKQQMP